MKTFISIEYIDNGAVYKIITFNEKGYPDTKHKVVKKEEDLGEMIFDILGGLDLNYSVDVWIGGDDGLYIQLPGNKWDNEKEKT